MSHDSALFAYAGARILARHGLRPTDSDWERLERIGDFGHYLQTARDTGLEPFIRHVGSSADGHEVERALRSAWIRHIREVAGWQPEPWRPALRWLATVTELPVLSHLLTGRPAQDWMRELPLAGAILQRAPRTPQRALAHGPASPLLQGHGPAAAGLRDRTWRHWQQLLPARPRRYHPPLAHLAAALAANLRAVAEGEADADLRLERTLVRTLRRHSREPAAAYAYLGLVALDLQRLRGGLLLRRLLPGYAA